MSPALPVLDKPKRMVRIDGQVANGETLPTITKIKAFGLLLYAIKANIAEQAKNEDGHPKLGWWLKKEFVRDALNHRDSKSLEKELLELGALKLNWSKFGKAKSGYTIPVPTVLWGKPGGRRGEPGECFEDEVYITLDQHFHESWEKYQNGYRDIQWETLATFSSVYAAKLFQYCAFALPPDKQTYTTDRLRLPELRELLGVKGDAYTGSASGRLYQEINRAVRAVNDAKGGIAISYIRDGRGPTGLHYFRVDRAEAQTQLGFTLRKESGGTRGAAIQRFLTSSLSEERRAEVVVALRRFYPRGIPASRDDQIAYLGALRAELTDEEVKHLERSLS